MKENKFNQSHFLFSRTIQRFLIDSLLVVEKHENISEHLIRLGLKKSEDCLSHQKQTYAIKKVYSSPIV